MKEKIKNQKGFIQISVSAIVIALIVVASVGAGVVLHKQGKLTLLPADISEVFKGTGKATILEEEKTEQEESQIQQKPEVNPEEVFPSRQELEKARLKTEKARQEAEKAKDEAESQIVKEKVSDTVSPRTQVKIRQELKPFAPSNLTSSLDCVADSIFLSWQDNSNSPNDEEYFEVWLARSPDFSWENWGTGYTTSAIATEPKEGIAYNFKVRAYNSSGYSPFSNTTQVYQVDCKATVVSVPDYNLSDYSDRLKFCYENYPDDPSDFKPISEQTWEEWVEHETGASKRLQCLKDIYGAVPDYNFNVPDYNSGVSDYDFNALKNQMDEQKREFDDFQRKLQRDTQWENWQADWGKRELQHKKDWDCMMSGGVPIGDTCFNF